MRNVVFAMVCIVSMMLSACQTANAVSTTNKGGIPLSAYTLNMGTATTPGSSLIDAYSTQEVKKSKRVFYISSSTGNDANDGLSEKKPWKNLKKLLGREFLPGDTIKLKCGDSWEQKFSLRGNGTSKDPITLTSYGTGKRPKISHKSTIISMLNPSGWVISGLELYNTSDASLIEGGAPSIIDITYQGEPDKISSDLTIENNEVHGMGFDKNCFGISVLTLYPYAKGETVKNIKLNNNIVHDVGWVGIRTVGWDTNKLGHMSSSEVYKNVQMNGNHIYNIGGLGSYLQCVNGGQFERNLVHDAGLSKDDLKWGPVGTMTISSKNIDVRFNEIFGMKDSSTGFDGTGIDIDWESSNVRVQYNYCHDNYGAGIVTMACQDSVITNNRSEGNQSRTTVGRGQIVFTDFTAEVSENRMTGVKRVTVSDNLIITGLDDTAGFSTAVYASGYPWEGNILKNNRFVLKSKTKTKFINIVGDSKIDTFAGNRYYSDNYFRSIIEKTVKVYNDFKSWKADGFDARGIYSTLDTKAPSDVKSIKATISGGNINVSWKKATDQGSGLWHYNIHLGVTSNFVPTYVNMLGESGSESFKFSKPKPGTYYIQITAEDNNGIISKSTTPYKLVVK